MAIRYKLGATRYRVRNPPLVGLMLVNGRKGPTSRSVDPIGSAIDLGVLTGSFGGARKRAKTKTANKAGSRSGKSLGRGRPKRAAAKKTKQKENTMARSRKRRAGKRTARRSNRKSVTRKTARRTTRKAARRRNRKSSTRRAKPKRKAARRRNRKTKRTRRASARRSAPRRRNRRRTARRSNRKRASARRAAPRRRNRKRTRRAAPRRASRRRNYVRRTVGGRRRSFGPTWRFNTGAPAFLGGRRRSRRRNAASATATGMGALKGIPGFLLAGANVGGGFLLTAMLSRFVEKIAGGRLGAANGIVSAAGALIISAFVPDRYLSKLKVVHKRSMQAGAGLFGVMAIGRMLLPASWREALGLGGFGEYLHMPGQAPVMTAASGFGEYAWTGYPQMAGGGATDAQTAQSLELTGVNPVFLADSMLTSDRQQQVSADAMMGMGTGEYIQWGQPQQAMAGLGHMPYNAGPWWGDQRYAQTGYPEPPASRMLNYGAMFRGFGNPVVEQTPAAVAPPAMMLPPPIPMPSMPEGACGPCGPGYPAFSQGFPVPQMPGGGVPQGPWNCNTASGPGPFGPCPPGGLPIQAYAPGALPSIPACSPDGAGGMFDNPYRTVVGPY